MNALIPPSIRHTVGDGDFRTIGDEFLRHFRDLADLQPADHILDVGCGTGRMAIPLTNFLTTGTYHGFDIVPDTIDWCRRNITSQHPHFQFEHADLYHRAYNPSGRNASRDFRFPYADGQFDLVVATSVFTHLFAKECDRYLSECSRVLSVGGRLFATFFLLNDEALSLICEGGSQLRFRFRRGVCQYQKWWTPEAAVAYPESEVASMMERHGFGQCDLHYGNWCGRREFVSGQDIVTAIKNGR